MAALSDQAHQRLVIRPMAGDDLDAVNALEQLSFPVPWSADSIRSALAERAGLNLIARLSETEEFAGYVLAWAGFGELHIYKVAVVETLRRRGVAVGLLLEACERAAQTKAERVWLEVRESNRAALALYAGLGFEIQGVRRGYYSDSGEDAIVMSCALKPQLWRADRLFKASS